MFKWPEQVIARLPLPEGYYWQDETESLQASIRCSGKIPPGFIVQTPGFDTVGVYEVRYDLVQEPRIFSFRYECIGAETPEDAARYLCHFTLFVYEPKEYP